MLELCDNMIHKTERISQKDAVENVLKLKNLPLLFLCESHSQAIILFNQILCNVYFNNAQMLKNMLIQVRREVVQQFDQR